MARLVALLLLLCAISVPGSVRAGDWVPASAMFAIPAQPLDHALAAYARASGVDILYVQGLAIDRKSTAISGRYSEAAALSTLLHGTGLAARFTSRKAAILFAIGTSPSASQIASPLPSLRLDMAQVHAPLLIGGPDHAASDRYGMTARDEIRRILSQDAACRGERFRVSLALLITRSGQIDDVALTNGSGDRTRDDRIRHALVGRSLPRPPFEPTRALQFEIDWAPSYAPG